MQERQQYTNKMEIQKKTSFVQSSKTSEAKGGNIVLTVCVEAQSLRKLKFYKLLHNRLSSHLERCDLLSL